MKKTLFLNGVAIGEIESSGDYDRDSEAARAYLQARGLWKDVPLARRIFNQAVAFATTASQLHRKGMSGAAPHDPNCIAPFVVNSALACELYLKALAQQFGKPLRGHQLLVLYEALPKLARASIAEQCPAAASDWGLPPNTLIRPVLAKLNDSFVEWRYVYERERSQAVPIQPTIFAMQALHQAYAKSGAA